MRSSTILESRVAELMSEKVRKGTACITDADVEEIIVSMAALRILMPMRRTGSRRRPEFPLSSRVLNRNMPLAAPARKRLYRDATTSLSEEVLGLANYLNTDPAIVRILFAIITFGGFGLGFVAISSSGSFADFRPESFGASGCTATRMIG